MTAAKKFKGFAAFTEEGTPCYVLNESTLVHGNIPAYKIVLGTYSGWHGWSGGQLRRDVHYDGPVRWIAKSKISRRKPRS